MISDIVPVNNWQGNSYATEFDFDFLINSESELKVLHTDANDYQTTLKLNIDYTINQVGNENGSSINFPILGSKYSVLKENEVITLMLDIPVAQTTPFATSAVLNLKSLEFALDYIVRLIQMMSRKIERSIKVQEGTNISPDTIIDNIEESEHNSLVSANNSLAYAKDSEDSAALSKLWATLLGSKVNDEDYSSKYYAQQSQSFANVASEQKTIVVNAANEKITEINTAKTNAVDSINSTATTQKSEMTAIKNEAEAVKNEIVEGGLYKNQLFDIVAKDHILTYKESQGFAQLGTYVYKTAVTGSRYGYPTFYNKIIEEYNNSSNYILSAFEIKQPIFNSNTTDGITISDSRNNTTVLQSIMNGTSNYNRIGDWSTYWLNIDYGTSTILNNYIIQADSESVPEHPSAWTLEGTNDGKNFIVLDNQTGQTFTLGESKIYNVQTHQTFKQYRIVFSAGLLSSGNGELKKVTFNANYACEVKRNSNGHIYYNIANKSPIDIIYNTTGIAWCYGVDTENERVFLPRNDYYPNDRAFYENLDWTKVETVSSLPYTVTKDGWWLHFGINKTGVVAINGVSIDYYSFAGNNWAGHQSVQIKVRPGDVISVVSGDAPMYKMFIPYEAVEKSSATKNAYMVVGNTPTESSITDIIDITTTENDTLPLFYNTYSKQDMTESGAFVNASLGAYLSGNIYTTAYARIESLGIGATFGAGTIKAYGDESITDYDLVLNADNMTFKLPLLNGTEGQFLNGEYPVAGNGYGLTLTNGSTNLGICGSASNSSSAWSKCKETAVPIGTTATRNEDTTLTSVFGVATDKSGLIAKIKAEIPQGWNLYYKLNNVVQNQQILDVAGLSSDLNTKISKTECAAYVVETSNKSLLPSWYRVWSDGWCEQGGRAYEEANIVTLLKSYKDANYNVVCNSVQANSYTTNALNLTATQFEIHTYTGSSSKVALWQACGYIS